MLVAAAHHRDAIIHVWPPWGVEDLARVGVLVVPGNVVGHHDHDVVVLDASVVQHLVGLQWKNASCSSCMSGKRQVHSLADLARPGLHPDSVSSSGHVPALLQPAAAGLR